MNQVSIGSDNGLSPIQRQAIIWTNAGLLSIGHLGTIFSEILIHEHASENVVCEMAAILSRGRWVNKSPDGNEINMSLGNDLVSNKLQVIVWATMQGSFYICA